MHERHKLRQICLFFSLHLPSSFFVPLPKQVYSHLHILCEHIVAHQFLQPSLSASLPRSGPLHLYLSDGLWILEAVLISTRGDIYCALCQVIALITWLVLHTWTESDVKLSGDELTHYCSSWMNMSWPTSQLQRPSEATQPHVLWSSASLTAVHTFVQTAVTLFTFLWTPKLWHCDEGNVKFKLK